MESLIEDIEKVLYNIYAYRGIILKVKMEENIMYKKFLLKCDVNNHYTGWWEDTEFYFDTKEEMICAIKNGINEIKPEDIRVKAAFELNKVDLDLKWLF